MIFSFSEGTAWLDEVERTLPTLAPAQLLNEIGMVLTSPSPGEDDRIGTYAQHARYVERLKALIGRRKRELRSELDKDIRRKGKRALLTPLGRRELAWYLA